MLSSFTTNHVIGDIVGVGLCSSFPFFSTSSLVKLKNLQSERLLRVLSKEKSRGAQVSCYVARWGKGEFPPTTSYLINDVRICQNKNKSLSSAVGSLSQKEEE